MSPRPEAGRGAASALAASALVSLLGAAPLAAGSPAAEADDDPARPLDERTLRAAYLDLLGRPPLQAEREGWKRETRDALVQRLLDTPEFWESWTESQLYYFLLIDNFRPTAASVLAVPEDLAAGRIGVREALHRVAISPSFDRRNPGPDTFVSVVMEQLLGLTVQDSPRELEVAKNVYEGGKGSFLGRTASSQSDLVHVAMNDRLAVRHLLGREYRRIVRAEPPRRELGRWAIRLEKEPLVFAEIVREWLSSDAYEERLASWQPMPNHMFVRALFVDLADRVPDPDELQRMRNALDGLADPGPLRSVLARLVLDSGTARIPTREEIADPEAWVADLFPRMLAREATLAEREAFVGALGEPECRPSTVVYAIVSHPDYPTW
jgi:hypothetical protein